MTQDARDALLKSLDDNRQAQAEAKRMLEALEHEEDHTLLALKELDKTTNDTKGDS